MNQEVRRLAWKPTKSDSEKGRWLLDSHDLALPADFKVAQSALVGFAPQGWAANHRHGRQEILLGLAGELYLIWRDSKGGRHEEKMLRNDNVLQVFVIAPNVPHLVENRSAAATAALYEWSDLIDESVPLEDTESLR
jgi:quercetin dioxygenase-like cupin family protein